MAKTKYTMNERGEYTTKVWDGTYDSNGFKHRIHLKSKKSSADLEKQVNALKESIKQGAFVQNTDITFIEYANKWITSKKSVREKNTQAMYRNIIDKHLDFLNVVKLSDIRNSHFQLAISYAQDKPRTCQQIYITFKQIINMAVADCLIGEGMARKIISDINLPTYIKHEKRALCDVEKDAIKKAELSERELAYINVLLYLGLRRGEALALTQFDFDFKKQVVNINKTVIFVKNNSEVKHYTKSENGMRCLPIPRQAIEPLKDYMTNISTTSLFTSQNGAITLSSYRKMWESIIRKLNTSVGGTESFPIITDLTAHIFRHNYCSNLCYQIPSISIKKIAQLMGDTEKVVLDVYNHIIDEKEDVREVLANAINL